jgi:prepilin-type N-terminal cleavage/methylation domain-containing protein
MTARLVWKSLRQRVARDEGFTLVETMMVLVVLGIMMALFSSAVQQIFGAEERTETTSTSQSQIVTAFQRLDKQIPYASGISRQGVVGADPYIEFQTSTTGTAVCTELRVHTANGQLQERTWTSGMSPLVPSAWLPLASGVVSTAPFTFNVASASYNYQRLEINMSVKTGSNSNASTRQTDITFTALNTSLATPDTSTQCTEGRAVA